MIHTTLNRILACCPCGQDKGCGYGFDKLLTYLGKDRADDEPLSFLTILESNGLDDAIWCCRAAPEYEAVWRAFARWCALDVIHLWDAPEVVVRYLKTGDESIRVEARAAARDAARAAALNDRDAAWAAWAAWAAALHDRAAWAARAAARDAAEVAAAEAAAGDARDTARDTPLKRQSAEFKRTITENGE